MSNNRLYIGHTETKEYMFVGKSFCVQWSARAESIDIERFIESFIGEGILGEGTKLIFFY